MSDHDLKYIEFVAGFILAIGQNFLMSGFLTLAHPVPRLKRTPSFEILADKPKITAIQLQRSMVSPALAFNEDNRCSVGALRYGILFFNEI